MIYGYCFESHLIADLIFRKVFIFETVMGREIELRNKNATVRATPGIEHEASTHTKEES